MDKLLDILIGTIKWIIGICFGRISNKNVPIKVKIFNLPIDRKWFFNKYPYKIEIYLNNKTAKSFYIDSIQLVVSKHQFDVMEFGTILNDTTPRSPLRTVCVQPNEAKPIEGIIEIGYGFDFEKQIKESKPKLILKIGKKTLKYKIDLEKVS